LLWSKESEKRAHVHFPHFLLSYFLYGRQFGNQFLVVASHATLDGFVRLQALQRLLGSTVVCVAEYLRKHLSGELVWQQAEALLDPRRSATLPCGITQLVLEVLTVHFVVPVVLRAVLDVKLDDLVIFTPSVISKPAESAEKYDLGTHIKSVKMTARATGDMRKAILTKTARLGYTSLAQRVKAGELTLSSTKGEYIEGSGTSGEPTVNP
jgi:hypothetical protein